jgi:hypothetical protein
MSSMSVRLNKFYIENSSLLEIERESSEVLRALTALTGTMRI